MNASHSSGASLRPSQSSGGELDFKAGPRPAQSPAPGASSNGAASASGPSGQDWNPHGNQVFTLNGLLDGSKQYEHFSAQGQQNFHKSCFELVQTLLSRQESLERLPRQILEFALEGARSQGNSSHAKTIETELKDRPIGSSVSEPISEQGMRAALAKLAAPGQAAPPTINAANLGQWLDSLPQGKVVTLLFHENGMWRAHTLHKTGPKSYDAFSVVPRQCCQVTEAHREPRLSAALGSGMTITQKKAETFDGLPETSGWRCLDWFLRVQEMNQRRELEEAAGPPKKMKESKHQSSSAPQVDSKHSGSDGSRPELDLLADKVITQFNTAWNEGQNDPAVLVNSIHARLKPPTLDDGVITANDFLSSKSQPLDPGTS